MLRLGVKDPRDLDGRLPGLAFDHGAPRVDRENDSR
jgi:hypothetical protein